MAVKTAARHTAYDIPARNERSGLRAKRVAIIEALNALASAHEGLARELCEEGDIHEIARCVDQSRKARRDAGRIAKIHQVS